MRDAMTEWAWGQVWSRPALSIERRILMNLGLLIALNRPNELRMAIRIALRHGLSAVEIGEAILHTAVYCGVPAAAGALCIASEVFAENLAPPSARPGPAHDSTTDDARSIESRPTKLRRSAPPMHKK
ncbi:MAG: carboxymuconolactone decarboxylase family protein [Proteobacteria bacterium]|nr:carboxymuconolactone decarboxylase family protein [Burkholderiales bacterium]